MIELQQQAADFLPDFDKKQLDQWMQADFTKKYMELANKDFPEIYQDIKAKCQARNKEFKKNG